MGETSQQASQHSRKRAILHCSLVIILLFLNIIVITAGHAKEWEEVTKHMVGSLNVVDPFYWIKYLINGFLCLDLACARARIVENEQLWSSFSLWGIVLVAMAGAIMAAFCIALNTAPNGPFAFAEFVLAMTAIVWVLRWVLIGLGLVIGWALGLLMTVDAIIIGFLTALIHGDHLYHGLRAAGAAVKEVNKVR